MQWVFSYVFDDVRAGDDVPAAEVHARAPRRAAPHQHRRAVDALWHNNITSHLFISVISSKENVLLLT